jgi:hypothetical protein
MIPVHLIDFSWRDVVSTYRFYQEAKALKDNHELFAYRNGLSFPYVFSLVSYAVICAFFFDTDAILLSSFFVVILLDFFLGTLLIDIIIHSLIQVFHNICSYYKQQIFQEDCSTVRYEYFLRLEFKFIPLLNGLQLFLCSENVRSI